MKILYDNRAIASTATITASSEATGYEASVSLKDTRLARKWRTTGDTAESVVIYNAEGIAATYCVIMGHNLTSDATVTLQGNDTNVWTSPAYSIAVPAVREVSYLTDETSAYITDENGDALSGYDYYNKLQIQNDTRIVSFTLQGFPYWRLLIADPDNADGYIEIGSIFLGEGLTMPGMSPDQSIPTKSSAEVQRSMSGQHYGDRRIRYKTADIKCPSISAEEHDAIEEFFDTVDLTEPFYLLVWESDLSIEPPIYSVLTKDLDWNKNPSAGIDWSLSFEFIEVK